MNNKIYSIDELRAGMEEIAKKNNIPLLYLFGSYARGDADENSDIDIVIDSVNLHGLLDLIQVEEDIQRKFDKTADVLTINAINSESNNMLKKEFIKNLQRERIVLYGK